MYDILIVRKNYNSVVGAAIYCFSAVLAIRRFRPLLELYKICYAWLQWFNLNVWSWLGVLPYCLFSQFFDSYFAISSRRNCTKLDKFNKLFLIRKWTYSVLVLIPGEMSDAIMFAHFFIESCNSLFYDRNFIKLTVRDIYYWNLVD